MNAAREPAAGPTCMPPVLVIGVGNECRGDDAAGRLVAERVAAWNLPGVRCLSVRQLVPELAAEITDAHTLVIVDADLTAPPASFQAVPLGADSVAARGSHHCEPVELLHLAELLGRRPPVVWLVGLAAVGFDWAAPPTIDCAAAIRSALDWLRANLPAPGPAHAEPANLAGSELRSYDA